MQILIDDLRYDALAVGLDADRRVDLMEITKEARCDLPYCITVHVKLRLYDKGYPKRGPVQATATIIEPKQLENKP